MFISLTRQVMRHDCATYNSWKAGFTLLDLGNLLDCSFHTLRNSVNFFLSWNFIRSAYHTFICITATICFFRIAWLSNFSLFSILYFLLLFTFNRILHVGSRLATSGVIGACTYTLDSFLGIFHFIWDWVQQLFDLPTCYNRASGLIIFCAD